MFGQNNDKKHDDKYKVGNTPMTNPDFSNAVRNLAVPNVDGVHVGPGTSRPTPPPRAVQTASNWGHPGAPIQSQPQHNQTFATPPPPPPSVPNEPESPQDNQPVPENPQDNHSDSPASSEQPSPENNNPPSELSELKQKALAELSPLVGQLDQSPEEKFHTIMMMVQASDDQSLLGSAHDAANQIQDEKQRAQALLDVVYEINYFTSKQTD